MLCPGTSPVQLGSCASPLWALWPLCPPEHPAGWLATVLSVKEKWKVPMDNPGKWYGNEYPHFSGKSARTKGAERFFFVRTRRSEAITSIVSFGLAGWHVCSWSCFSICLKKGRKIGQAAKYRSDIIPTKAQHCHNIGRIGTRVRVRWA